jgi:hypothetical protein
MNPVPSARRDRAALVGGLALLLLVAVCKTNYGLWNADVPLGDEAGSVEQAYRLLRAGRWSSNLYVDLHIACYKFLTPDPVVAHSYLRFAGSLLSVLFLFLFLSRLGWVSVFGAFGLALIWNLSALATPFIQQNNPSLLAFAFACAAGFLWMGGRKAKVASALVLVAVASWRVEYALVLALMLLRASVCWLGRVKSEGWPRRQVVTIGVAAALALLTSGTALLSPHLRASAGNYLRGLDQYLFLGLKQCYTAFHVLRNPESGVEPMIEFDRTMSANFPGASGFFEAVAVNPREILRYFVLNGFYNLSHLYYLLPTHSVLLPTGLAGSGSWAGLAKLEQQPGYLLLWAEQVALCVLVAAGGLWLALRRWFVRPVAFWTGDDAFFVLSLAAVAVPSLLLHIPNPRYWIELIPLVYWGPAALASKWSEAWSTRSLVAISAVGAIAWTNPVFTSTLNESRHKDKDVVLLLRQELSSGNGEVIAVGAYPYPLMAFALPGRFEMIDNVDIRAASSSYEEVIRSRKGDLVLVDDWLMRTEQHRREEPFFRAFVKEPEAYGYERLLRTEKRDGPITIFKRSERKFEQ